MNTIEEVYQEALKLYSIYEKINKNDTLKDHEVISLMYFLKGNEWAEFDHEEWMEIWADRRNENGRNCPQNWQMV